MNTNYPTQDELIQALEIAFRLVQEHGGEPTKLSGLAYRCDYLQIEGTLEDVERARRAEWLAAHSRKPEASHV